MDDERMSVEENKSNEENNNPTETEDEVPAIDTEGEIIYDRNAARPDYKLFSLRQNSCLNFHQMINLDNSNSSKPILQNKEEKKK